ncbi:MAG: hypothetical protein OXF24_05430, partial [Hyphomicrobiales bacterium]|nr:hypothetical protein [Hyphomicrobiales bacterium]
RKATVTLTSEHTDTDSISLTIGALDDADRFDDIITFAVDEDNLPDGYRVDSRKKAWAVRIIDDDKRIVGFRDASGSVGEGETVTTEIQIPEGLVENVSIPFTATGDRDAYLISVISPAGASISNGMVHFIQSEDSDSVTLQFKAIEDIGNRNETITIAIDADSLPQGYRVDEGGNNTWTINITDDDTRAVGFRYTHTSVFGDAQIWERRNSTNLQLHISPPLEAGQNPVIPLKVTGDSDAYWLLRHSPAGAGVDLNHRVYFAQSEDADSVTFDVRGRQDADFDDDLIRVAIDEENLPDGYHLGANSVWNLRVLDNMSVNVRFALPEVPDARVNTFGRMVVNRRVGDVVNVRIRAPGLWRSLIPCTKQSDNNHLEVDVRFCSVNPTDTYYHTVIDDSPRGGGGVVSVISTQVSYSEREFNFQVTAEKAGFYSMWIVTPTDRAVIGEPYAVWFNIFD